MIKPKTYLDQIMVPSVHMADPTDEFLSGEFGNIDHNGELEKIDHIDETPLYACAILHDTTGRSDRTAIDKATILDGEYLAEIDVYDSTATFNNGDFLTVRYLTVTYNGVDYSGGFITPAATGERSVAMCIVPPGNLYRGDEWMLIKVISPTIAP